MKVLMSVANILLDVDFNNAEMLNDAAKIAFNRAKTAYEDHFSGGETYIDDDDYPGDSILWGAKEPEKLIRVVSHWNEDIWQDFKKALAEYINGRNEETGEMPFNDQKTYALAKTALAMDNDLHEYGKKANLLSYDYLEVILTGDQILEVCKNPQNYAIVEVSPR